MADVSLAGVTLSDPSLDELDAQASWEAVQDYCGWHIAPAVTETIVVDGWGHQTLMLPTLRVTDITKVVADGVDVTADIEWSEAGLVRLPRGRRWPRKYRSIEVTLTHGFDKMPAAVAAVVKRNALNAEGGPKQIMAGPFLEINRDSDADGLIGYSDAAMAALSRYALGVLPA